MSLLARREKRVADLGAYLIAERSTRHGITNVGPDQAMRIAAVWGCIRTIAEPVAGFPVDVFRKDKAGVRTPVEPQPPFIANPSSKVSRRTWTYQAIVSLLYRGNCYGLHTVTDANGWPLKTEIIHPDSVSVTEKNQLAPPVYRIGGQVIPNDQIMHISAFNVPGSVVGLSPIAYAASTLGVSLKAQEYGASFYNEGGHPTGALKTEQKIDGDQAKDVKARFIESTRGTDRLAVLGSGWDYSAIQVSPGDAMFLEAINASAIEICQFFGVPPEMNYIATSGSSVTYANREQRAMDFIAFSLQWWLTRLEEVQSSLLPNAQFVKYNVNALLRGDAEARAALYESGIQNHWLLEGEVRSLEDLPPLLDEHRQDRAWQPVGLPALVTGGLMTQNEARAQLGLAKIAGGDELVKPLFDPNAGKTPAAGGSSGT